MTATIGSILDLKPVLTLTRSGKIVAFDKVKGRRKVVKYLLDKVAENKMDDEESMELAIVCHGDNPEQAQLLKEEMEARFHYKHLWFLDVGPVIGCHAGPGVMAVLILGKEREK